MSCNQVTHNPWQTLSLIVPFLLSCHLCNCQLLVNLVSFWLNFWRTVPCVVCLTLQWVLMGAEKCPEKGDVLGAPVVLSQSLRLLCLQPRWVPVVTGAQVWHWPLQGTHLTSSPKFSRQWDGYANTEAGKYLLCRTLLGHGWWGRYDDEIEDRCQCPAAAQGDSEWGQERRVVMSWCRGSRWLRGQVAGFTHTSMWLLRSWRVFLDSLCSPTFFLSPLALITGFVHSRLPLPLLPQLPSVFA